MHSSAFLAINEQCHKANGDRLDRLTGLMGARWGRPRG
jgi:hypothetical protein